jgi:K+ transporter
MSAARQWFAARTAWACQPGRSLFALMERNAAHVSDFFSLPSDQVVEMGRLVAI